MPITLKEALFLSGHNEAASTPALSPGKKADDFSLSQYCFPNPGGNAQWRAALIRHQEFRKVY